VGWTVDFLSHYSTGQSLRPLYLYAGSLTLLTVITANVRLQAKSILAQYAVTAGYRARVYGFERLMNHSIEWHDAEGTGNKIQRVTLGSSRLEDCMKIFPMS
jgi:ABC-type multidrug transport system fused ATPase/permease subunit